MPLSVDSNNNNDITVKSSHIVHLDLLARAFIPPGPILEAYQQVTWLQQRELENILWP